MAYRKLPLERLTPELRQKLAGQTPQAQKAIMQAHLVEVRKQLAQRGVRKFTQPILSGQTNAKKINRVVNRWKRKEILNLVAEGKKPANLRKEIISSFSRPLRKRGVELQTEQLSSQINATKIASRFLTREIVEPMRMRNYSPEVIRTTEQLLGARERVLPGVTKPVKSPTAALILKAINSAGSDQKGIALIKYLAQKTGKIKDEAIKAYKQNKSDSFKNIANTYAPLAELTAMKLKNKQSLIDSAMPVIIERKKALAEVTSRTDAANYIGTIKLLQSELADYQRQIHIFARANKLPIPKELN